MRHDPGDLVGGQRRLGQVGDAVGVDHLEGIDIFQRRDHRDPAGRLTDGALDLLVVVVPDEHDVVALCRESPRFGVNLAHERAGRVDDAESALLGAPADLGCHAVGGEHQGRAGRHVVDLLHEHGTLALEVSHDVGVVHDLPADVDGRREPVDRPLDDVDGPLHPGAERAGTGEQDRSWTGDVAPTLRAPARWR